MKRTLITFFASGVLMLAGNAQAAPSAAGADCEETVTLVSVDKKLRPPHTRRVETLCTTDVALLEREDCAETVKVKRTRGIGKPPFRRITDTLCVSDVAALELALDIGEAEAKATDFRGRPPFQRH